MLFEFSSTNRFDLFVVTLPICRKRKSRAPDNNSSTDHNARGAHTELVINGKRVDAIKVTVNGGCLLVTYFSCYYLHRASFRFATSFVPQLSARGETHRHHLPSTAVIEEFLCAKELVRRTILIDAEDIIYNLNVVSAEIRIGVRFENSMLT
ncbi:uncharacterized protein LOC119656682 [Hermetia illucens]|uniref:uncharacterized protein LOC119656682 n=1 Tax=Hermetia illucens TaxID=343691 RepID=UPI0018CC1871|nr:uncharacterized protein LOC119656682 [Hermetia illucens]